MNGEQELKTLQGNENPKGKFGKSSGLICLDTEFEDEHKKKKKIFTFAAATLTAITLSKRALAKHL